MHSHQDIIEKYQKADFEHRLSLFLECPSLRDTFVRIDQGQYERSRSLKQNSTNVKIGRNRKISRVLGLVKSCLNLA